MVDLKTYVGVQVRSARTKAGLTQEQLAERIDKAVETISNIERGHSATSLETLATLAAELDIPLVSFFEGRKPRDKRSVGRIALEEEVIGAVETLDDRQLKFLIEVVGSLRKQFG